MFLIGKEEVVTVYLDIVFAENVLMNYIILFSCVVIFKLKPNKIRLFASSTIGAIYTIIMYLNIIPLYSNFFMKFILSVVMVYVAFYPHTVKKLCKEIVVFYLSSFVFGGCVFALMYFIKPQMVQIRSGVFVGTYPIKIALIGGILAFVIIQLGFKFVKNKLTKKDMIYKLEIKLFEKMEVVNALLDTGNLLKEPITGMPVVIVEKEALKNIIPVEILNNTEKVIGGDVSELNETNTINEHGENLLRYISRFRMIPFSSVGKQNGLLLGIKCDSVKLVLDEVDETTENVIIGIYDKSFTKNGLYSAIFGMDIIEGSTVNENVSNIKV